ncbi:MAG: hypothetical protein JWR02_2 [Mucilaginibacter sp.]|nr:hypothetical protein [Mucilaginibacter sp.]
MQPIYLKADENLPLMIIPESDAHMDGHPVLTYSYCIFKDHSTDGNHYSLDKDQLLSPERKKDPNYLGTITFEQPGKLFNYTADGEHSLGSDEIHHIIEEITHYRENPGLWTL